MVPLAMLLTLLATAHALEDSGEQVLQPCAEGGCTWDDVVAEEAAGARLLQHAAQLHGPLSAVKDSLNSSNAIGASEGSDSGNGRPRSLGFHYMMLLQPAGAGAKEAVSNYAEALLVLDTCFTEILVTLDYGVHPDGDDYHARIKAPGAALKFQNESHAVTQFFCEVKEQTRSLADTLEKRCGGKVSAAVHLLDVSLPHVQKAARWIFGPRDLPRRMFKNTLAYLYGPAAMKAEYIVHVDDDMIIERHKPQTTSTFVQEALQVLDRSSVATVNMPCCTCPELACPSSHLNEFRDSRGPKFSGLAVGQLHYEAEKPDNLWKVRGLDNARCAAFENFITTQAYVMHARRFRAMYPLRVGDGPDPAEMQTECLLTEAAKQTAPPTVFAWLGEGSSQCRRLVGHRGHHPVHPSAALTRCMAHPAAESPSEV